MCVCVDDMLDSANALERTAMMVLTLTETLRHANHTITTTPISSSSTTITTTPKTNMEDPLSTVTTTTGSSITSSSPPPLLLLEYEQGIVQLAPRIRRVEKDIVRIVQENVGFTFCMMIKSIKGEFCSWRHCWYFLL